MATGRALGPALGGAVTIASYPWVSRGSLTQLLEGDRAVVSFFFFFLFFPLFFLSSWLPTARKPGPSELERAQEGVVRRMYLIQQETSGFLEQPLPEPPEFCGNHVLLLSIRPDFVPDHRTVESVEGVL